MSEDRIVEQVRAELLARSARGRAKYGVTVGDNPLSHREWLQHAFEEALDFAIYLKRAMETAGPLHDAQELLRLRSDIAELRTAAAGAVDSLTRLIMDYSTGDYPVDVHGEAEFEEARKNLSALRSLLEPQR